MHTVFYTVRKVNKTVLNDYNSMYQEYVESEQQLLPTWVTGILELHKYNQATQT